MRLAKFVKNPARDRRFFKDILTAPRIAGKNGLNGQAMPRKLKVTRIVLLKKIMI